MTVSPGDSFGNIAVVNTARLRPSRVQPIIAGHRDNESGRRLASIPGGAPITVRRSLPVSLMRASSNRRGHFAA